jgi:prevent-host-death family protein
MTEPDRVSRGLIYPRFSRFLGAARQLLICQDRPGARAAQQPQQLLDDVSDRRDHVLVTRNGTPAAALVPIDEYKALEETAEVLSDPDALSALEAGLAEIERDETVTLTELRSELAERRPTSG